MASVFEVRRGQKREGRSKERVAEGRHGRSEKSDTGYNERKKSRTSRTHREDAVRRTVHVADIDHQNIFVAGSDTSSAAAEWAMTELMRNPEAMKKAQDEARRTFTEKREIIEESDEFALSNSFGFGGTNASLRFAIDEFAEVIISILTAAALTSNSSVAEISGAKAVTGKIAASIKAFNFLASIGLRVEVWCTDGRTIISISKLA